MKKILLFLLFFIFPIKSLAQLDTQHWFAPMFDGQSNPGYYQYIYLSTNETTPFTVEVYNNNVVVYKATISKGSPQSINITNRDYIITKDEFDLNKVDTKGFYLKGSRPFYASLRFGMQNHAEIITSKGTSGIGKEFFTVSVPNSYVDNSGVMGFGASFLATEDNTTVTVSNFKKTLAFNNYGYAPSFTFKLNKGESYIIDGRSDNPNNQDGFIGATVTSDKPISMSNGSFNGQFSTKASTLSGTDIYMDQSVPVDKLGDEFVIVKGYGAIGNKMEGAVIVATVGNTQIYLNDDSTTPATTLANPGDYYVVDETNYVNRGNDHYNLHIKASKNIYVYQMMGGVENSLATGGMNYIPPLNCYLPRKIDEIGSINVIGSNTFLTKLNIITEKGAEVKVNGVVPNAQYGPYDTSAIPADQKWVSYSIPNQTGNITVVSDKAVTAGLSGGSVSAGFGGYFAGFSSIPAILPANDLCLPDRVLQLEEGFAKYKWMFRDKNGITQTLKDVTGSVPDANKINPTQIGYYWAEVQQGSCNPVTTNEVRVLICGDKTSVSYNICDQLLPTPVKLSLDNVPIVSINESEKPAKGQLIIDNVAKTFSYIPNPGTTTDKFTYEIVTSDPNKNEKVEVTINVKTIPVNDTTLQGCRINATNGGFDLTKITVDPSISKVFYKDQNNADNDTGVNTISAVQVNSGNYVSPEGFVYLRLDNGTCKKTVKVELKFYPYAELLSNTYIGCNEDFSAVKVKLDQVAAQVLKNASYFPDIKFYLDPGATGTSLPNDWSYTTKTTVYMIVTSPDGCAPQKFTLTFDVGARIPLLKTNDNTIVCDDKLDNTENIKLDSYKNSFLTTAQLADPDIKTYYYRSLEDAQKDQNRLPNGDVAITSDITYHYRFTKAGVCSNVGSLSIKFAKGFASTSIPSTQTICDTSTVQIDAGNKHVAPFQWVNVNNPAQVIPTTQKVTLGPGKYYVILTSPDGCDYKQNFEIVGSPKAILDISKFNSNFCDNQFNGQIDVKFSTQVTPVILKNPHPDIKVEYYKDAGYTQLISGDNFSYSADHTKVYVKATSKYCTETRDVIDFRIGSRIPLSNMNQTKEVCDDDLDGKFTIKNLNDFRQLFTSDNTVTAKFYTRSEDAKNNATNNITEVDVNNQKLLYVRFESAGASSCPNLGELTIKIKVPKKSDLIADKTICPDDKADVAASSSPTDFQTYQWYNESDPTKIIGTNYIIKDLTVGKYFVILTGNYPNDCPIKQKFEIKAAELPVIDGIEINGSTVKILASGGKKPYRYAVDGSSYQDSNVFDLAPGIHKAYVVSADNCDPVEKEFSVIKIYNLITPNDDGVNDVLDMSLLKLKVDVKFQIFDRNSKKLFEGNSSNNYIWDGKQNGKPLPSSSYWYMMEWKDFDNSPPVKYTGWILLKNRNSD